MVVGSLTITDPWEVPDEQLQVEVVVIGRSLDGEGCIVVSETPLGWGDWGTGSVALLRPRLSGQRIDGVTIISVNGYVWGGRWRDSLPFIASLELSEEIPPL